MVEQEAPKHSPAPRSAVRSELPPSWEAFRAAEAVDDVVDAVSLVNLTFDAMAICSQATIAHGKHAALMGFFFGGIGQDNTACRPRVAIQTFDDYFVTQRNNFHGLSAGQPALRREPLEHAKGG